MNSLHRFENLPYKLIVENKDSNWDAGLGVFIGAFLAFIFGLATFIIQKKWERYSEHKNALVVLENLLNEHLNTSGSNKYLLEGAITTLNKDALSYTLLSQFELLDKKGTDLGDLIVLNEYFTYKDTIIKLNHSMATWEGINEIYRQNVITNSDFRKQNREANSSHLIDNANVIIKFLDSQFEDTVILLALIRVFMRKERIWLWLLRKNNQQLVTEKEIGIEILILKKEIEDEKNKSKSKIAKIDI